MCEKQIKQIMATEIIKMIKDVAYSKDYVKYRVNWGSRGVIELILKNIEETYLNV